MFIVQNLISFIKYRQVVTGIYNTIILDAFFIYWYGVIPEALLKEQLY